MDTFFVGNAQQSVVEVPDRFSISIKLEFPSALNHGDTFDLKARQPVGHKAGTQMGNTSFVHV
jgi:hypothetical protein